MSITIYEKKDFKGKSRTVSGNLSDLKGSTVDKPSSIKLSSADDEVLLFKNDDWHGKVLYLRGAKNVADLGEKDRVGSNGFGNSIRSIRRTPFQLDLNVTVVKNDAGNLPGRVTTEAVARAAVQDLVTQANGYYAAQRALLTLQVARVTFRTSEKHFVFKKSEGVPNSWTERGEVDLVITNRFADDKGTVGVGHFPCWGQTVVVAAVANPTSGPDQPLNLDEMTYTLVHELGHYLGLTHRSANDSKANLMFDTMQASYMAQQLRTDQIEEMHQKLARNLARRGDRN